MQHLILADQEQCLPTWTPKVRRIMAFWAIFRGFGPFFYLLWGFRQLLQDRPDVVHGSLEDLKPKLAWQNPAGELAARRHLPHGRMLPAEGLGFRV